MSYIGKSKTYSWESVCICRILCSLSAAVLCSWTISFYVPLAGMAHTGHQTGPTKHKVAEEELEHFQKQGQSFYEQIQSVGVKELENALNCLT